MTSGAKSGAENEKSKRRGGRWPARRAGRTRYMQSHARREAVLDLLRRGNAKSYAAAMVGVSHHSLAVEEKLDEEFAEAVREAQVEGKIALVERIFLASEKAVKGDWRAAAWLLERKYFKEFARRDPESVTPAQLAAVVSRVVAIIYTEIPPEYVQTIRGRIEEILSNLSSLKGERASKSF